MTDGTKELFTIELGRVMATPGVIQALYESDQGPGQAIVMLSRHAHGDWGDLDDEDRESNDRAASLGGERILSSYNLDGGGRLWIITEADRSATTLLLPEEY